ncbi:MAG: molecular chaperone DnaJ [Acidimicrobiia bacterium]
MAPQREWFEKDYYEVLGLSASATDKDVQKAYRNLAKQYHPDANSGDAAAEERFKEISAAHEVLGDPDRRKEYDEVRQMVATGRGPGAGGFGGRGFEGATFDFGEGGGLGDLFGGLFGGGAGRQPGRPPTAPQRGHDLETELRLDFLDAVHGVTTSVALTSDAACSKCGGNGAEPGTMPERCATCGGSGSVAVDQGPFSFSQVCPTCGGRGQIVTHACSKCRGTGVERRRRNVKVRIPAGVRDGQRIRVKGRGGAGRNGGPPGDLFVVVHVGSHPIFGRSGAKDLTVTVPVTFPEAALGAQVKVPTLDAPVTVKVPAGTESGKTVRVRGRGISPAKGNDGDLLVTFEVVVPKKPNADQRAAVEALAETLDDDPRAHLGV